MKQISLKRRVTRGAFVAVGLASLTSAALAAGQGQPVAPVGHAVSQAAATTQSAIRPLAGSQPPVDLAAPSNSTPAVPSVDAYKAQLDKIAARQRRISELTDDEHIANLTLNIDKTLMKIHAIDGKSAGGRASPGKHPHAHRSSGAGKVSSADHIIHPMEVVSLGGVGTDQTAAVYVQGVGLVHVRVGSYLPGKVKVASISESGISVVLPDGAARLVGLGGELGNVPSPGKSKSAGGSGHMTASAAIPN